MLCESSKSRIVYVVVVRGLQKHNKAAELERMEQSRRLSETGRPDGDWKRRGGGGRFSSNSGCCER
jgi:hypothetical protein